MLLFACLMQEQNVCVCTSFVSNVVAQINRVTSFFAVDTSIPITGILYTSPVINSIRVKIMIFIF